MKLSTKNKWAAKLQALLACRYACYKQNNQMVVTTTNNNHL